MKSPQSMHLDIDGLKRPDEPNSQDGNPFAIRVVDVAQSGGLGTVSFDMDLPDDGDQLQGVRRRVVGQLTQGRTAAFLDGARIHLAGGYSMDNSTGVHFVCNYVVG